MIYSPINHTDLKASKIILGTDGFGTQMSKDLSFEMLDKFVDMGGNIIDTASFYADWMNMGKSISEKTIGEWLTARKNRDKIIISTKGGHPRLESMYISRLSRDEIFDDFEHSLINLNTDYIDIYWLHKDDPNIPPERLIEIMNEILDTGKAKYIAVSNWGYDRIRAANDYAKSNGLKPFIAGQIQYSVGKPNPEFVDKLIYTMDDAEYQKYAADTLNVFAFSSQSKGFFAMLDSIGEDKIPQAVKDEFLNAHNLELYNRLKEMSKEKNVSISALMLSALTSDDNVNTFVQIGPRKIEYLTDSMSAKDLRLTPDERGYLMKF